MSSQQSPTHSPSFDLPLWRRWLLAIRPKTLPAATSPVLLGTALALGDGVFRLYPALACLLVALLLQIGSNVTNDLYDYKKGSDTHERIGPLRVTQAGLLSPTQMKNGMILTFGLSVLVGLYLVYLGGWPILLLGILAIVSALLYTAGPFPLGYLGIADFFVFFFFGPVAVCGTYYLQALQVTPVSWWASVPSGLLITGVLVVNNYRDLEQDRKGNKKTLVVRFGAGFGRLYFVLLVGFSYLVPLVLWRSGLVTPFVLLAWLTIPIAIRLIKEVYTVKGPALNLTLAGTAKLGLFYSIFFSLGYLLGTL